MRSRRLIAVLAVLMVAMMVFAACGQGQPDETAEEPEGTDEPAEETEEETEPEEPEGIEEIVIGVSEAPRVFDPDLDQGMASRYDAVFSTLLDLDKSAQAVPHIATEWEQPDDTTIIFTIRDDATWHDGEPLTVDDIVFTWDRMSNPDRASTNFPRFEPWLDSVEKVDDSKVQFNMKKAYAPALYTIAANFHIFPKHYIEEVGDETYGQEPLGSGPYKVIEWKKDTHLKLERHDDYFEGTPPFPKLTFRTIPDQYTRATALLSGDLDMIVGMPTQFVSNVSETAGVHIAKTPGCRIQFLQFPHESMRRKNTPEIEDKRVRQALNYALDREKITQTVGQGYFTPVPGPWSPGSWAYPDDAWDQAYEYNPDKAKELLAEAGYEDGFTLYLGSSIGFSAMDKELMEATVPYFEDIGLDVEFLAYEWSAYDGLREANEFSVYYLGLSGGCGDPHAVVNFYMTSHGRKRGFYGTDPRVDEVVWQGEEIMDFEERKQFYQETVFPELLDIAPWIYLWSPIDLYGVSDELVFEPWPEKGIDIMRVKEATE